MAMLYDETTTQVIDSAPKKHYIEKSLRLVCDSVCVPASGHALLVDNGSSRVDRVLLLVTLITPKLKIRGRTHSFAQAEGLALDGRCFVHFIKYVECIYYAL